MTDSRRWKGLHTYDLGHDEWVLDPVYFAPDWLAPGSRGYQEIVVGSVNKWVEGARVWEGRRAYFCIVAY